MQDWCIPYRKKQIISLRLCYLGGYTGYFANQLRRMLDMGFTVEEIKSKAVDDAMRKWIDNAVPQVQKRNA